MAVIITICLTNTNRHYSFMNVQDYIVGIWNIYRTCHCISLHYNKTVFTATYEVPNILKDIVIPTALILSRY